jgi:uncharacterized membrane protein
VKKDIENMMEEGVELIVAAFQDELGANRALDELKIMSRDQQFDVQNAAILRKDEQGKLHIKETADMGSGKGTVIGGSIGAAIGVVAGAALVAPIAVGALIGGLSAKAKDAGFKDERRRRIGESLKPGSSAVIAVTGPMPVDQFRRSLEAAGADLITETLSAELAEQLEAGHDVAYSAMMTQGAFVATHIGGDKDEIDGEVIIDTSESLTDVQFVATKDGIQVRSKT